MSSPPTTTAGPQQPRQPSGQGDDLLGPLAVVAGVVAVVVVGLPVLILSGLTWAATRHASARVRAGVAATGVAFAGGVVLGLSWRTALARYALPFHQVLAQVHHHGHVTVTAVVGTGWVALPLGLLAGVAAPLVLARRQPGGAKAGKGLGEARQGAPKATPRELKPLVVRRPPGDRVVLGKLNGRLLAAPADRHVAIIAPTRSGKTRCLILPALLEWSGPVVATSSKADLLRDPTFSSGAYAFRKTQGPVWVFDPSGSTSFPSVQWSPLGRAETWQGALRSAAAMVAAERPVGAGDDGGTARFFAQRAAQALAPALHAVALAEGGMRDVLALVRNAKSLSDLADNLEACLEPDPESGWEGACPEALSALGALRSGSDTSSGDTLATLANLLSPYDDPKVAENTDDCEFEVGEFIAGRGTLFIVAGPDSARLAPLYACLLDEIFSYVAEKALRDGPLSPRLLLALDEIANIAPVAGLPQRLATVSGQGVTIVTAWQNLGQMQRVYGPSGRGEILGNSACQLWTATDDPETSEHLSKSLGRTLVETVSVSADVKRGWFSPAPQARSTSTSWTERAVLDPSVSRLLSGPLLIAQGLPPTELQWRFHDQDRSLSAKSSLPMPPPEPDEIPKPDELPDEIDGEPWYLAIAKKQPEPEEMLWSPNNRVKL